jgi:hypothetical protein
MLRRLLFRNQRQQAQPRQLGCLFAMELNVLGGTLSLPSHSRRDAGNTKYQQQQKFAVL